MKNARKEEVKKEIIMSGLLLKNWIENGKNKVPNNIQGLEDIRNLFAETVEPKEPELAEKVMEKRRDRKRIVGRSSTLEAIRKRKKKQIKHVLLFQIT